MGLADLSPDKNSHRYKHYPPHEWDDKLEDWAEQAQSKFPGGVEYDFIEVSPRMTQHYGFAYYKGENGYIRISEKVIEKCPAKYVKMVLIHELAHLWFLQNGYQEYSDGSGIFEWVLGRVGADIDGVIPGTKVYEIMMRFLDD